MKISLCIITKNEEANLQRCLTSAALVADEIIVVDSGSTDDTEEVARKFGVRWVHQDWLGFVKQKNFALNLASHDWVLSLDADEALSADLFTELLSVKESRLPESIKGFSFPRCVFYEGKWIRYGDWYPDRLVRLFNSNSAEFRGGKVHERLHLEGEVKPLNGEIEHYSFSSVADQKNRLTRYSELWAESQFEKNRKPAVFSEHVHAFWSFFRGFFLKMGFMNGRIGWQIAATNARGVFQKYLKLRQMWSNDPKIFKE